MKLIYRIHLSVIAILLVSVSLAQTADYSRKLKQLELSAADSLKGFDEMGSRAMALADGFVGPELQIFLYKKKRNYIDNQFKLYGSRPNYFENANAKPIGGGNQINAAPCVNEDFEATAPGQYTSIQGWTISEGQNGVFIGNSYYNTCSVSAMPNNSFSYTPSEFWVRATPIADANFPGGIPASPLGGTRVAQLNNAVTASGQITRISQTFPVTASNCLFRYAYAACFNGAGHVCCDQPFLNIKLKNCNNQVLPCPQVSVVASGPSCVNGTPGFATNNMGYLYKNWTQQAIDLTQYIGSCITIEVAVGDCSGWAHFGYCYFDALCVPMDIVVNGVTFPAGTQATTVSACGGVNSATITAPPGLAPYNWNGPAGSGVVNNPNQTIIGNISGNYTLVMNPVGSCSPITKYVTLQFAPTPTAGLTYTNTCNTFSFTFTGSPTTAVQSYSFNGPSPPPNFTTNATNTVITFNPGTYTITQVVTNTAGCTASLQTVIVAPQAPNANFAVPNPTQCLSGNSYNFIAADPSGTHAYSFSPGAGAPAPGNVANYGPVSFTQPGTYTVTHSINTGGCTNFTSSVVLINPQPPATANNGGAVCVGAPILLMGGGGNSYSWSGPNAFVSAIQNPTIINAQMSMNGAYTVTVTSAAGCTATAVTDVTVYTLPSPTITSNAPVCQGGILTLTASGGANYSWTGPNGFTSNLITPVLNNVSLAASGVYSLQAGTGNCTVSTTSSITINPLPVVNAGSNSTVCVNQDLLLNSGGGVNYAWTGPGNFSSGAQNPTITMAQLSNAGIYTVTATDNNGCSNTATTDVVVAPLPTLTVNNPTACPGTNLSLTSGGANTYAWSGPNAFSSNAQNPVLPNAQVNMTGQYTLVGTSVQGCTSSAVSSAVVFSSPSPNIGSNSPQCFGSTLNLFGSGGSMYFWAGPNNFTSSVVNPQISNVTLNASGDYTLLVSSVNGCTASTTASITINPLPVPVIQMNTPFCEGDSLLLNASGGVNYVWAGPNNFNSNSQSNAIANANVVHAGVYSLTATDANSCVNSTTAMAVVRPLPSVNAMGSTVCIGATATLNLITDGASVQWTGPNNFSSSQTNILLNNLQLNQAGNYTVLVTAANQCTAMAVTTISNFPVPTPTAMNSGPVCMNQKVEFTGAGGLVYNWYGPNGFISDQQSPSIESANSVNYSGTYTLGVIDEKGCQGSAVTNLLVRPLPTAMLSTSANKFCVPFCATYSATSTSQLGAIKWEIDNDNSVISNTFTSCFTRAGGYTLKASFTDVFGCANTSTALVEAYPVPVADFHYAPGNPVEYDQVYFSDASRGEGINQWTWYFASNNNISLSQNPAFSWENAGIYPVAMIVTNRWGCKDTIVKPVTIGEGFNIYVPNAFTPNSDNVNDTFQPKGYGIVKYNMMVFDRWGERLFTTSDFFQGWDGTFKGKECKQDTYIWKIYVEGPEGQSKNLAGTVTLIR